MSGMVGGETCCCVVHADARGETSKKRDLEGGSEDDLSTTATVCCSFGPCHLPEYSYYSFYSRGM